MITEIVFEKKVNESLFLIYKTIILIEYYHFDLGNYHIKELIAKWSKLYPHEWLPLAVLEALYEGRIKAVSVEQILNLWQKKGEVGKLFNREFEKIITYNLNLDKFEQEKIDAIFHLRGIKLNNEDGKSNDNLFTDQHINNSKPVINKLESIINFEPMEDYSNCFNKLKSLVEQNKLSES